ncbi:MAG: iron ABC transporter permease [Oscillospiraceae bacterium]|nr:iron ABC transporter permease [Oscillospiraceae bacterium]
MTKKLDKIDRKEYRALKKHERQFMDDKDTRKKEIIIITALSVALVAAFILSLGLGRYHVPVKDILIILKDFIFKTSDFTGEKQSVVVVTLVRLPRLILCVLVGICLSASGAAFQGLFKNPMVSPDILGVSTGAAVGACIAILMDFSAFSTQVMAFAFGLLAVVLVLGLASCLGKGNPQVIMMILAGMVISSLFNAVNTLIKYVAIDADDKLAEITFWLMGSFSKSGSFSNVLTLLIATLVGGIPLLLLRWRINVLAFGEEEAEAMGVNTKAVRITVIVCATIMTASSVSMVGNIGWVGLTLPHITRLLVGPNYKVLLPTSMLSGALFLVVVDDLARTLTAADMPIGIFTAIIGAPLFIYLMFKGKRGWS